MDSVKKLNIASSDLDDVICVKCGSRTFTMAYIVKTISPLLSGHPTRQYMPITLYQCSKCGEIPEEFTNDFGKNLK